MSDSLQQEASAFDNQIIERIANGHIPDLRLTKKCDYFYNNVWRRPEYVDLAMGEQYRIIVKSVESFVTKTDKTIEVLEVGSGPGYMSLELARTGYNVTGIDISSEAIKVAEHFAKNDPWIDKRGSLEYYVGDFFTSEHLYPRKYDVIVFLGALHHFKDQDAVMVRAQELLSDQGIVIAHEPTRDRITEGNAVLMHLIQTLLSVGGGFYKEQLIPNKTEHYQEELKVMFKKLRYEDEDGGKLQSVNDNDAGYEQMSASLCKYFEQLELSDRTAFFTEIVGGLRFDEDVNINLAKYLKEVDTMLVQLGLMKACEFLFVGRKKGDNNG